MKRAPIVAVLSMLGCLLFCLAVAPLAFAGAPEWAPSSILTGQASAAEAAALKATMAPAGGRTLYAPALYNDYVDVVVGSDGRFTMGTTGGDPDNPNDDYQLLLYGYPDPGTSYTTIRIDGEDHIFGSSAPEETADGMRDTFWTDTATVQVDQILTLVPDPQHPGRNDTLRIEYRITTLWAPGAAPEVGVRIMLDTMLGYNDGAPFRVPGGVSVTSEVEYYGGDVPGYWRAFDSLDDPMVSAQGTLGVPGTDAPDRLVLAYWPYVYDASWDYSIDPLQAITGDSAVCMYWNPQPVSVGSARQIATQYGLGEPTPTPASAAGPLVVLISGLNSQTFDKKDGTDQLDTSDWQAVIDALEKNGYTDGDILVAKTHKGGPDGYAIDSQSGDWDNCAKELAWQIAEKPGNRPVILVGHSMGGLIARAYADNWKAPQAKPLAIIQLGTPNEGSPPAALQFSLFRNVAGNLPISTAMQMLGTPKKMDEFNDSHRNINNVPIYRIAGTFFPWTALWQTDILPMPWRDGQVGMRAIARAWHLTLANDYMVTDESVKGGPPYDPGKSALNFPAIHAPDFANWPFFKASCLLPRNTSPSWDYDEKVLDKIIEYVRDASGHSSGGGGGGRGIETRDQSLAPAEQATSDMDTAPGWTTCAAESVSLTGGPAATTFTIEGTIALVTVAADSGEVSLAVKDSHGVAVPCATTTDAGVTEGTIGDVTPGAYTLTLTAASGSPTEAEVRISDTGPSSLRLLTPGQVEAGKAFTVEAAVYQMGGSIDVPTFTRNTKALSVNATAEGAAPVSLRDDGVAPDETAGDGIYAASLTAPSSGSLSSLAVTAGGKDGAGVDFMRQARAAVAIAEPRATLSGPFAYRLNTDSSGKITDLLVDVTVSASQACSLGVAIDVGSGGKLIAQSAADAELAADESRSVTVTVPMTSLYAGLAEDGSFVVSRVALNDYTDDMPTMLDAKTNVASGSIPRADIAYSRCSANLIGPNPAVSSDVSITGDAVCTTEPISMVEYSLDEGMSWSEVPAPADGWGGLTESWELPLNLADGSYAIVFRAQGDSGPIAGAEAYVSFAVDTVSPYGTFTLAGGAATTRSTSVTTDATVGNLTAPIDMRFSCDFGTTWSAWEPFSEHAILTLPRGLGQKTAYVEYRDADSNVLELSDSIELLTAPVTPKVTLKLSGLTSGAMKLGKSLTAKGKVTPTSFVGSKVKLTVQKKKGARWVTLKSVTRTISATGAYSWKYKPAKKGAYHMRATIAKTAALAAATTTWRSFKVK